MSPPPGRTGVIGHPMQIKVEVLDPVRRGHVVRLRVTTRSSRALESAEVRLESTGAAKLVSEGLVELGMLQLDLPALAEFHLRVPQDGPMPLQFVVRAGEGLKVTRGVTINLLPEGPQQLRSVLVNHDGSRTEVFSARNVDP